MGLCLLPAAEGGLALREAFMQADVVLLDKFAAGLGRQVAFESLLRCQRRGADVNTRLQSSVIRILSRKFADFKNRGSESNDVDAVGDCAAHLPPIGSNLLLRLNVITLDLPKVVLDRVR